MRKISFMVTIRSKAIDHHSEINCLGTLYDIYGLIVHLTDWLQYMIQIRLTAPY